MQIWNKRLINYYQTSVLFFIYGGILSRYSSLLALHLSGTPSLKTGTRSPRYLHLHNRLYILIFEKLLSPSTHRFERKCKYKIYKTESSLPGLSMTMMKESCLSKQSRILTMCLHPYTLRNKHTSKGTGWPLIWKKHNQIRRNSDSCGNPGSERTRLLSPPVSVFII